MKKYLLGITETLFILLREKPRLVICQNPSIVLALFLILINKIIKIKICVDAHNAGLFPCEGESRILNLVSRFIQKKADLNIVTNDALKAHVEKNGGRAFVLQDRIPNIPIQAPRELKGKFNILFICSFGNDEPYEIIFNAARNLDESIYIYVSGDYRKASIQTKELPPNVILTGFLPEVDYVTMLNSVNATIDLTTRENCLVCGAYESVAVEKPMILSDTKAIRDYFCRGVVYTENKSESLTKAILEVLDRKEELSSKIKEFKSMKKAEWEESRKKLEEILTTLC